MKITGTDALEKRLKRLATLSDVQNVVKVNGTEMQRKAMRKVPVDTGALKRSIGMSMSDGGLTAIVGASMEYAPYVEWGTRFNSAQPYLRPSLYEQREKFKNDLARLMKK